jgi:hypothetical protein
MKKNGVSNSTTEDKLLQSETLYLIAKLINSLDDFKETSIVLKEELVKLKSFLFYINNINN